MADTLDALVAHLADQPREEVPVHVLLVAQAHVYLTSGWGSKLRVHRR